MYMRRYPPMLKLTMKRKEKRMTIGDLAKRAGVNYNTISQYENGIHKPRIDNIQKLAEALECEIKDII